MMSVVLVLVLVLVLVVGPSTMCGVQTLSEMQRTVMAHGGLSQSRGVDTDSVLLRKAAAALSPVCPELESMSMTTM
jgi:hypothetical protein